MIFLFLFFGVMLMSIIILTFSYKMDKDPEYHFLDDKMYVKVEQAARIKDFDAFTNFIAAVFI